MKPLAHHEGTRAGFQPDWHQLIQAEYAQMPGLALTLAQAQRLWGLDPEICSDILEGLRVSGALRLGRDARYRRARES